MRNVWNHQCPLEGSLPILPPENGGSEKVSNLPNVPQPDSGNRTLNLGSLASEFRVLAFYHYAASSGEKECQTKKEGATLARQLGKKIDQSIGDEKGK